MAKAVTLQHAAVLFNLLASTIWTVNLLWGRTAKHLALIGALGHALIAIALAGAQP